MAIVLGSYDELTDFGVLTRPELANLLDTMAAEELMVEERFIKHGTVILFKDGPMLQAVKVRGTARQREVWFAPSSRSSRVRGKIEGIRGAHLRGGFSCFHECARRGLRAEAGARRPTECDVVQSGIAASVTASSRAGDGVATSDHRWQHGGRCLEHGGQHFLPVARPVGTPPGATGYAPGRHAVRRSQHGRRIPGLVQVDAGAGRCGIGDLFGC